MIYFTSDLHFNHNKPFLYEARGFSCVEDMNEAIVRNWNSIVGKDDIVFCLGDLCFGYTENNNNLDLIKSLNGHIALILGNHDTENKIKYYQECPNIDIITFGYRVKYKKRNFYLSHYPMLTANRGKEKPTWCISGHTHNTEKFDKNLPLNYCVCLDAHNLYPVSIKEVFKDIKEFEVKEKLND